MQMQNISKLNSNMTAAQSGQYSLPKSIQKNDNANSKEVDPTPESEMLSNSDLQMYGIENDNNFNNSEIQKDKKEAFLEESSQISSNNNSESELDIVHPMNGKNKQSLPISNSKKVLNSNNQQQGLSISTQSKNENIRQKRKLSQVLRLTEDVDSAAVRMQIEKMTKQEFLHDLNKYIAKHRQTTRKVTQRILKQLSRQNLEFNKIDAVGNRNIQTTQPPNVNNESANIQSQNQNNQNSANDLKERLQMQFSKQQKKKMQPKMGLYSNHVMLKYREQMLEHQQQQNYNNVNTSQSQSLTKQIDMSNSKQAGAFQDMDTQPHMQSSLLNYSNLTHFDQSSQMQSNRHIIQLHETLQPQIGSPPFTERIDDASCSSYIRHKRSQSNNNFTNNQSQSMYKEPLNNNAMKRRITSREKEEQRDVLPSLSRQNSSQGDRGKQISNQNRGEQMLSPLVDASRISEIKTRSQTKNMLESQTSQEINMDQRKFSQNSMQSRATTKVSGSQWSHGRRASPRVSPQRYLENQLNKGKINVKQQRIKKQMSLQMQEVISSIRNVNKSDDFAVRACQSDKTHAIQVQNNKRKWVVNSKIMNSSKLLGQLNNQSQNKQVKQTTTPSTQKESAIKDAMSFYSINNTLSYLKKNKIQETDESGKNSETNKLRDSIKKKIIEAHEVKRGFNIISGYRIITVIFAEIEKFSKFKIFDLPIPIYERIVNRKMVNNDFEYFLKRAQQLFCIQKPIEYAYLVNEKSINDLTQIPLQINVVLLSSLCTINFWERIRYIHNLEQSLNEPEKNYIIEKINKDHGQKQVTNFVFNKDNFIVLQEEMRRNQAMMDTYAKGLMDVNPLIVSIYDKWSEQIENSCNSMEFKYKNMEYQRLLNMEQETNENQYSKLVDELLIEMNGIKKGLIEEKNRQKNDKIITKYYLNELDSGQINKQFASTEIHNLFRQYSAQIGYRQLMPSNNFMKDENILKAKESQVKNFIQLNKQHKTSSGQTQLQLDLCNNIDKAYPALFNQNIPQLITKYKLSRYQLHYLYSRFKALIHLNAMDSRQLNKFEVQNGIDLDTFQKGLLEKFASSTRLFMQKMFRTQTTAKKMEWIQHLNILNSIKSKSLTDTLSLFFKLMDDDGNGELCWPEIHDLCVQSIKKLTVTRDEWFISDIANVLTKIVYDMAGVSDYNKEIPIEKIKNILEECDRSDNQGDVDLIMMMCCTERGTAGKSLEDEIREEDENQLTQLDQFIMLVDSMQANEESHLAQLIREQKNLQKIVGTAPEEVQQRKALENTISQLTMEYHNAQSQTKITKKQYEAFLDEHKTCIDDGVPRFGVVNYVSNLLDKGLEKKLKELVDDRRKNEVYFEDDNVIGLEAKILTQSRGIYIK